jgi:hypothetical protein
MKARWLTMGRAAVGLATGLTATADRLGPGRRPDEAECQESTGRSRGAVD